MAKTPKQQVVTFHNAPSFYLEYMKNWAAKQKADKANPAEIAIVEDIAKLVEIAVGVLDPEPAEPANDKK